MESSSNSETVEELQGESDVSKKDGRWRKNLQRALKDDRLSGVTGDFTPEDLYSFEIIPEQNNDEDSQSKDGEASDDSKEDDEGEGEEGGDENDSQDDSDSEMETLVEKHAVTKKSGKRKHSGAIGVQKKKKKSNKERRNIKKIFTESQLDPQTLEAQLEERERLRRLELQKNLLQKAKLTIPTVESVAKLFKPQEQPLRTPSPLLVESAGLLLKGKQDQAIVISDDEDHNEKREPGMSSFEKIEDKDVIALLTSSDESSASEAEEEDEEYIDVHTNDELNVKTASGSVLINVSHPADEPDIFAAPQIGRAIQPHQIGGIRFLYDNLIETIKRTNSTLGTGFGCILAHAMGLGKTVQTIAFIDVFLRHTSGKKVLCIVPINTILNWVNEFNLWVPAKESEEAASKTDTDKPATTKQCSEGDAAGDAITENIQSTEEAKMEDKDEQGNTILYRNYEVFSLSDAQKTTIARGKVIGMWHQRGGVLLMGYEMFRMISLYQPSMCNSMALTKGKKKKQKDKKVPMTIDVDEEDREMQLLLGMQKAICKPGPDLVVCDEGHRIKNFQSNISHALHKIKTRRRLVLTGYPLQNNLMEYWCMVDFVRPNYLGTRGEFSNMFERPIMNGQCLDSTPGDKKLMRYRAHVLSSLLKGFVQRRDHGVLRAVLPTKEENVIMIRLSDAQQKLYRKFITLCHEVYKDMLNPIKLFAICCKIWNHPDILHTAMLEQTGENPEVLLDTDDDIAGLTNATSKKKMNSEINNMLGVGIPNDSDTKALLNSVKHWSTEVYSAMNYATGILENSGKLVVLMEIINESLAQGDKVLVFSQSLLTLDLIEKFLSKMQVPCYDSFEGMGLGSDKYWTKNRDYYRIDGRTVSSEREKLIRNFNDSTKEAKLFLLSTRAGCLGVNLTGANRVVVFDVSWNPCHDAQAVCRVYRYGQFKACKIYRLVASNTMEQRMYVRQISKQGISDRVVDELNPTENVTKDEMNNLISVNWEEEPPVDFTDAIRESKDPVMKKVLANTGQWIVKPPFEHESLLEDQSRNRLSRLEKKMARLSYEKEKRSNSGFSIYDNTYGRSRPDSRPVVTVPPFIQNQTPPLYQNQIQDRLALVNSYLNRVYSLNKGPYQAGAAFSAALLNARLDGNFAGNLGSDFLTSSGYTPWGNTMPLVDALSGIGQSLLGPGPVNMGDSTISRAPTTKYEPYTPSAGSVIASSSTNQNLSLPNVSILGAPPVVPLQVQLQNTNSNSGNSDMADSFLNRQFYNGTPSAAPSRVSCHEDVIVIDGED